jgi:hypothetical protein
MNSYNILVFKENIKTYNGLKIRKEISFYKSLDVYDTHVDDCALF